jgi:hypothetical protein
MQVPRWLEVAMLLISLAMFVGSLVAVPIALVRLPPDYFARPHARHALGVRIVRDVVGAVVIALGIIMLVLPGQGMLTILLGVGIVDLPWKQRLARRIMRSGKLRRAVNRLRERGGKPPLVVPPDVTRLGRPRSRRPRRSSPAAHVP